jgi:uncharacterized protein
MALNRTVLITGATGGLGVEFARHFYENGWQVVVSGRNEAKLQSLVTTLGENAQYVIADLALPNGAKTLYDSVIARGIQVACLVNNAGFANYGKVQDISIDKTSELLAVNVTALTELTRLLLPSMVAQNSGSVLNIASTAAFMPGPLMASYYASKAYVLSFSEALSEELKGSAVHVTCLCPGPTATGFQAAADMGKSKLVKSGMMSAKDVVREAYSGVEAHKRIVIPGLKNKIQVLLPRLLPRTWVAKIVLDAQKPENH